MKDRYSPFKRADWLNNSESLDESLYDTIAISFYLIRSYASLSVDDVNNLVLDYCDECDAIPSGLANDDCNKICDQVIADRPTKLLERRCGSKD